MSSIRIDLKAVEASKLKLDQGVQKSTRVSGRFPSTMYQVDYAITSRRNIRSRMDQSVQRVRELERRLRSLNTFMNSAQQKYSGLEIELVRKAEMIVNGSSKSSASNPASSNGDHAKMDIKDIIRIMALALGGAMDWLKGIFKDQSKSTSSVPISAGTGGNRSDQPQLLPYEPDKYYSYEDVLNRDDPKAYERLMKGPFGRMTEQEQKEVIAEAKKSKREHEWSLERWRYGDGFAAGFGYGIEKTLTGLFDGIVDTVSNPKEAGKVAWGKVENSYKAVTTDPWGVVTNNYDYLKETGKHFWYGDTAEKGTYIGSLFTGIVLTRGVSQAFKAVGLGDVDSKGKSGDDHKGENGFTGIGKTGMGIPLDQVNPKVLEQIYSNQSGAFGYLPKEGTPYANFDFTDVDKTIANQVIRKEYLEQTKKIEITLNNMTLEGKSLKEIAKVVTDMRNQDKVTARAAMTKEEVVNLEKRNIQKYGNPVGPDAEWLFQTNKGKLEKINPNVSDEEVWKYVIEGSLRKDEVINTLLGIKK